MPDWITHIVFAYFWCVLFRLHHEEWQKMFWGSISLDFFHVLPTMLTFLKNLRILEVDYWLLRMAWDFHEVSHSIMGILLWSTIITVFYHLQQETEAARITKTWLIVLHGATTHLFLDSVRIPFPETGYMVFYPLSTEKYSLGWISPANFVLIQVISMILALVLIFHLSVLLRKDLASRKLTIPT